jgi:hypothetical protein
MGHQTIRRIKQWATLAFPWEAVRALNGKSLTTVRGRTFDILTVADESVVISVLSTGKTRSISRAEFERAHDAGLFIAGVRPQQLRDANASEANPAYVAAIIREILQDSLGGM